MPPKGSNSSKTAHVMNLLRKNNAAEPSASAAAAPQTESAPAAATSAAPAGDPAPQSAAAAAPVAAAPAPRQLPILTELNADAAVSTKIKDALESALLDEQTPPEPPKPAAKPPVVAEPQPTPAPIPEPKPEPTPAPPAPEAASAPAGGKLSQAEIERMLQTMIAEPAAPQREPDVEPQPEPLPAPEPTPAPIPEPKPEPTPAPLKVEPEPTAPVPQVEPAPKEDADDETELINIMLFLAEEKADKYIKMFGLCDCARCKKDVLALTLNDISSKYVVMPRSELMIRSDMYRTRYDGEITVQILRACQRVMETPRHKKP